MNESELRKWGQTSLLATEDDRIRQNMERRSLLIQSFRTFLHQEGFVEVDTPILRYYEDPTDNPPFITLGPLGWPRLHLRTCPEEYTRRCACAFGKAFEIGKCFRNEHIKPDKERRIHLPEFTMAEIYEVDADLDRALSRIESIVRQAVLEVNKGAVVKYQGVHIDFGRVFPRVKVLDALNASDNREAKEFVARHRTAEPCYIPGEDRILHRLLDEHVKPKLAQSTFLTHFPKSADQLPDQVTGNEIQRAELVAAYMEIGEVGALQPDGEILCQHATAAIRGRHGNPATSHLLDVDYLSEIKGFNRSVGGGAIGIDRLLMLLCDTNDIREVVWYPLVGKFYDRR